METFPFKKVVIALIVIMAIVAGVGLYLGSEKNDLTTTTPPTTLAMAVNGSGTTSPAVGEHEYSEGEAVTITAIADSGWQFDSWGGDVANLNSTITTVTMDSNKTVTANFSEAPVTTPTLSEEQAYRTTIAAHISILNQALSALSELMANPQIGDAQWRVNVVVQLALIQALYDDAIELDPPSSMAHIHDKYVEAMEHYNTATQLIAQGIDEVDVNLLEQAIVEMNTGTQLLTEAIELLNEFT